jgi:DNA-binding transcriptional LysR family regulator
LIGFDEADAHLPEAVWLSRRFSARRPFSASNQFAQGAAARSGVGVALLSLYIGRAESSLLRCNLGLVPAPREVFVVRRRQNARTMPINVVVDHLAHVFKEDRALFEDDYGCTDAGRGFLTRAAVARSSARAASIAAEPIKNSGR